MQRIIKNIFEKIPGKNRPMVFTLLFLLVFSAATFVFAAPPGSPFTVGQTLDPGCAPGSANCYVNITDTFHNLDVGVDPVPSNDFTEGYSVGSLWYNTDTEVLWVARSVGLGTAYWVEAGGTSSPAGVTELNGLTGSLTVALGTDASAGNDVNIALPGSDTITINLPTASASVRGLLSTEAWATFNSKLSSTLTNGEIWIGSAGGVATPQALTGDVTITNTGVTTIGIGKVTSGMILNETIVDDDIASGTITNSKLVNSQIYVGGVAINLSKGDTYTTAGNQLALAGALSASSPLGVPTLTSDAVNAVGAIEYASATHQNGLRIANNTIHALAATEYYSGIVTATETQTFGGAKIFSGLITANNGITVPDGKHITLVAPPTDNHHAVNLAYVQSVVNGLRWKEPVRVATTEALVPAYTYDDGAMTMEATVDGLFPTIDGVTLTVNDRILIKNETGVREPYNGVYVVTNIGGISDTWILERCEFCNEPSEFTNAAVAVFEGTVNAGTAWTQTETITDIGDDDVRWIKFLNNAYTAGDGINISGNAISVNLTTVNTGVLSVARGGTGLGTPYAVGEMLYADTPTSLAKLSVGGNGDCLTSNGSIPVWGSCVASGAVGLHQLGNATAVKTDLDAFNYHQQWNWSTLAGGTGFSIASNSVSASGDSQLLFEVALSGVNTSAGQVTTAARITNSHSGTTSTNIGLRVSATGGTAGNYALIVPTSGGNVGIGNSTPSELLSVGGTGQFTVNTDGNVATSGTIGITNDTNSTSVSTGSLFTAGGVGIAKALYVGADATITAKATVGTSLQTPLVIGGTAANNSLTLRGTSATTGNTPTNKNIEFLVGDMSTSALQILNNGTIKIPTFTTAGIVTNDSGGLLTTTTMLPLSMGGTNNATFTTNGVVYSNGSALISTAASTAANQCLITTALAGAPTWAECPGGSGVKLNSIAAADNSATVNHLGHGQTWQWNSLANTSALKLSTNSTAATGGTAGSDSPTIANLSTLLTLERTGNHADVSAQATYGMQVRNAHGGGGATNVGIKVAASGGVNNYAIIVPSGGGAVGIGLNVPTGILEVVGQKPAASVTPIVLPLTAVTDAWAGGTKAIILTAGEGGNTSSGSSQPGTGGGIQISAGKGGVKGYISATPVSGGHGGPINITSGLGGDAAGTNPPAGGNGGDINIISSDGGSGGNAVQASRAGDITIRSGMGGLWSTTRRGHAGIISLLGGNTFGTDTTLQGHPGYINIKGGQIASNSEGLIPTGGATEVNTLLAAYAAPVYLQNTRDYRSYVVIGGNSIQANAKAFTYNHNAKVNIVNTNAFSNLIQVEKGALAGTYSVVPSSPTDYRQPYAERQFYTKFPATLHVVQPDVFSPVAGTGYNNVNVLTVIGGRGGGGFSSSATNFSEHAGDGGGIYLESGYGGDGPTGSSSSSSLITGGNGGGFVIKSGQGGRANSSGAPGSGGVAGNGGDIKIEAGHSPLHLVSGSLISTTGGGGTYAGFANGGSISLTAGNGGYNNHASSGVGGSINLTAGAGGIVGGSGSPVNKNGGNITLNGGAAGTGGTGGVRGTVAISSLGGPTSIGGGLTLSSIISCAGLQTNGSGVVSCTSDSNYKDVRREFTTGLNAVMMINPQIYSWKEDSYLYDGGVEYTGFIAQNVQIAVPTAVTIGSEGQLQLSTVAVLATAINAIKELNIKIEPLASLDTSNENSLGSLIRRYLESATNGLRLVFVDRVRTKELCIEDVCVTKAQLQGLLNQTGGYSPAPVGGGGGGSATPPVEEDESPVDEDESPADNDPAEEIPEPAPVPAPAPEPEPTPAPESTSDAD